MTDQPAKEPANWLGPLEVEVMDILWDTSVEEMTVNDVLEVINEGRVDPYAYSTVVTVMARLAKKGLLERRRAGKAHAYWAGMDRDAFVRSRATRAAQAMLGDFGDLALTGFVDELRGDPERLRELRRLIDEEPDE